MEWLLIVPSFSRARYPDGGNGIIGGFPDKNPACLLQQHLDVKINADQMKNNRNIKVGINMTLHGKKRGENE